MAASCPSTTVWWRGPSCADSLAEKALPRRTREGGGEIADDGERDRPGAEHRGGIELNLTPEQIAAAMGAEIVVRGGAGDPRRGVIDSSQAGEGDLFFGLRGELGAPVVGITGSVGKTSVKDIARALLPGRVHANRENLNTEIGLPLTLLEAPADSELLVLEMAMRGPGQIAELAAIAQPRVAVITNVGPVHVELLGSAEAGAGARAEELAPWPAPTGSAEPSSSTWTGPT